MIWIIWKKIFFGTLIAAALLNLLPTRIPNFIVRTATDRTDAEGRNPSHSSYNFRIHIGIPPQSELEVEESIQEDSATQKVTQRIYRDRQGNIITRETVTETKAAVGYWLLKTNSLWLRSLALVSSGFDLPFASLGLSNASPEWFSKSTWIAWALIGAIFALGTVLVARRRYTHVIPPMLWGAGAFVAPVLALPFFFQFRHSSFAFHK